MKQKQHANPILVNFDGGASELLFWSYRYFVGRMTGATCNFAESLAASWPHILPVYRSIIKDELTRDFARDDELRAERASKSPQQPGSLDYVGCLPLGQDCDREAWEKVRQAWLKEEEWLNGNSHS
jgi:hypothetical protein